MAISGAEYKAVPVNVLAAVVTSILAVPKSHIFNNAPLSKSKMLNQRRTETEKETGRDR